jgi:hypothetical protein
MLDKHRKWCKMEKSGEKWKIIDNYGTPDKLVRKMDRKTYNTP